MDLILETALHLVLTGPLVIGTVLTASDGQRYLLISMFSGHVAARQSRQPNATLVRIPPTMTPADFGRGFTSAPTPDDSFAYALVT